MNPRKKKWWLVALLCGVVVLLTGVFLWQDGGPQVSAPFDVDEFLAPELFEIDRAPTAYRAVFSKLHLLNKYSDGVYETTDSPSAEAEKFYLETDGFALELIAAGNRRPGVWFDTRVIPIDALMEEMQTIRLAARMLKVRTHVQLAQDKPPEALESILACFQLGRHAGFRGGMVQGLLGIAVEKIAMKLFNQWAAHEQVSPEMILDGLSQIRSLQPARSSPVDLFKGEYPMTVRGVENPNSLNSGPGNNFFVTTGMKLAGLTGRRSVRVFDMMISDRLSWCESPAWERRQWEMTLTGPRHLDPVVPEVEITRDQLDALVGRYPLIQLLLPTYEAVVLAYDRKAVLYALMETRAGLIAFHKRTGSYPERLEELVPDYLPELPLDPFSGRPLVLVVAEQEMFAEIEPKEKEAVITAGQKVLYSIGPEGLDMGNAGWLNKMQLIYSVFPLPKIEKQ